MLSLKLKQLQTESHPARIHSHFGSLHLPVTATILKFSRFLYKIPQQYSPTILNKKWTVFAYDEVFVTENGEDSTFVIFAQDPSFSKGFPKKSSTKIRWIFSQLYDSKKINLRRMMRNAKEHSQFLNDFYQNLLYFINPSIKPFFTTIILVEVR